MPTPGPARIPHSPAGVICVGEHRPAGQWRAVCRALEHSHLLPPFLPVWTTDRLYPVSSHPRGVSGAWVQLGSIGLLEYRGQQAVFLNFLAAWTCQTEGHGGQLGVGMELVLNGGGSHLEPSLNFNMPVGDGL